MVQEAFVRAWSKLDLFRGDSKFGTWLHRLAVNVVLSDRRIRVKRLRREQEFDENVERVQVGDRDVFAGLRRDLEAAIAGLPERARTVLILYDIEGYRHEEIAEMTGMAVGSSKAQLHRARKLVQEVLEDSGSI
jgi:RNA polymerase sigma-70 factor (ECF subfamily)